MNASQLDAMLRLLVVDYCQKILTPELAERIVREEARKQVAVLSMDEAGKLLGCPSARAARATCKRLGIPVRRISPRRRVVLATDVAAWLESRKEAA